MSEIFSNADILMLPSFISTTSDKIDTVPVEDGQIIVLSDKSGYFYDFDGKRRAVGGISFIPDLSESGQEDILYICTEPAGLYLWNSGEYSSIVHDSNVPDLSVENERLGCMLYKTGAETSEWGAGTTYFCRSNSTGEDNSAEIGKTILDIANKTPMIKLTIAGELNVNYGPLVIPDLSSAQYKKLTIILDFSQCVIKAPYSVNSVFSFIQVTNTSNIESIHIRGLLIDHSVAPLSIISADPAYPQSMSVYFENCSFLLGRYSNNTSKPYLLVEGTGGTYPTYYFDNCTFKSNYDSNKEETFRKGLIVNLYQSSDYPSFMFFNCCKFMLADNESALDGTGISNGAYGITNYWGDNHIFRFTGCVMSESILMAQADFSSINTSTKLQVIFNNSNTTGTNILY